MIIGASISMQTSFPKKNFRNNSLSFSSNQEFFELITLGFTLFFKRKVLGKTCFVETSAYIIYSTTLVHAKQLMAALWKTELDNGIKFILSIIIKKILYVSHSFMSHEYKHLLLIA